MSLIELEGIPINEKISEREVRVNSLKQDIVNIKAIIDNLVLKINIPGENPKPKIEKLRKILAQKEAELINAGRAII
jgi:hypothetical protein